MSSLKIARQPFRRAKQSTLAAFTNNIIQRMDGVAAYESLQVQVQPLAALLLDYQNKLSAARNRGIDEMLAKTLAQKALTDQLDLVATYLQVLAKNDVKLVINAGFSLQQDTGVRYGTGKLPTPIITSAISTGKRGEVRITVDDQVNAQSVATHAVEYSLNRESGWTNGTYHSHRNFVAEGLPRTDGLWLRLKSLGYGNNKSEWSEPVVVAVL